MIPDQLVHLQKRLGKLQLNLFQLGNKKEEEEEDNLLYTNNI